MSARQPQEIQAVRQSSSPSRGASPPNLPSPNSRSHLRANGPSPSEHGRYRSPPPRQPSPGATSQPRECANGSRPQRPGASIQSPPTRRPSTSRGTKSCRCAAKFTGPCGAPYCSNLDRRSPLSRSPSLRRLVGPLLRPRTISFQSARVGLLAGRQPLPRLILVLPLLATQRPTPPGSPFPPHLPLLVRLPLPRASLAPPRYAIASKP